MEAILKFNLPEEREEHLCAVKSRDMASALFDIANNMCNEVERSFDSMPSDEYEKIQWPDALERIRKEITEILEVYNINLNELIS